jgi:uncharacterized protein involved in exopolysaccharide biosynthesis
MTTPSRAPAPERPHLSQVVPPQEIDGADADLFDYGKLRDYLAYVVHAVRRHKLMLIGVLAGVVGACAGLLAALPKSYHCEIKIQAQRNTVISTLAGLSRSWDFELPTRAAADLVLRHDNLVALVRKTRLVAAWDATRAPALRLKDAIWKRLRGEQPLDVREDALIGTLEQRLSVVATEDTVTIGIDWPDAKTAYRLIQAAHENFLEARQYKEVSAVSEAIGLLQGRAVDAREKVNVALERVYRLRGHTKAARQKAAAQARAAAQPKPAPARPLLDPDLQRLRAQLQSKRQVIAEMEEYRRRRIAELASKLAELKQVYSEFHPAVADLQQTLQQQEREENPQLATLRQEYRQLEDEYEKRGGPALESSEHLSSGQLPIEALQIGRSASEEVESPEVEQAKADLKHEVGRYSSLTEKIDQARLDLESQRAAFHYRYGVLRPAAVPNAPEKPKQVVILGAAAVLGLLLGILAAVLADVRSGRVHERWQIERSLELPVLGEVRLP